MVNGVNEANWMRNISKTLPKLNYDERWKLSKQLLPDLEKNKARDLLRLLFSENTEYIYAKLADAQERNCAIEYLSYFPSRETVKVLVMFLSHQDSNVQLCAAGALKNHTPRLVVPSLIRAMLHDEVIPARAGEVLLAMGSLAQDTILEVYSLALPKIRVHFLELLILGNNPKCKPFVDQGLISGNTELVSKALDAVSQFAFSDLWPQVIECLHNAKTWTIKAKTLQLLGTLKIAGTKEYIIPYLHDEDPWVCQCAASCLEALEKKI